MGKVSTYTIKPIEWEIRNGSYRVAHVLSGCYSIEKKGEIWAWKYEDESWLREGEADSLDDAVKECNQMWQEDLRAYLEIV